MKYHIQRITRTINGVTTSEACDIIVGDLEAFRKMLNCNALFIYGVIG